MSVNVVWMTLVGFVIGLITSTFVRGGRLTGLAETVVLGVIGYGGGGLLAERWGFSVLEQWLVGIAATLILITGYILIANAVSARIQRKKTQSKVSEATRYRNVV